MALLNYATKEITLKIVYYGPGLSGKTTNLQQLHSALDPVKTGKLLSLATETDRTLFFDFLPIELGRIKDFSIRFQLYTVPGQVKYNATRKVVLKGADAVVFVADSQKEMKEANIESLSNMRENLLSNNINPDEIPIVIQYNKRDLKEIFSINDLNKDLNRNDTVYIEAEAVNGRGVQETFQTITKLLIKDLSKKYKVEIQPAAQEPVQMPQEHVFETPVKEEEVLSAATEEPVPVLPAEEQTSGQSVRPSEEVVAAIFPDETGDMEVRTPIETPAEAAAVMSEPQSTVTVQKRAFEEAVRVEESVPVEEIIIDKKPASILTSREPVVQKETWEERKKPDVSEMPAYPAEKIDKITVTLEDISQMLVSLKVSLKNLSDEFKKSKEEQKEILNTIRELSISEKIKRKKKKGWFGF